MTSAPSSNQQVRFTRLPNGIRVITEAMPSVRSVTVGIWVDSGSRREEGAENGISHFIEHMLFKGTERRSAEDIARAMDSLGGHLDAFTGKELVSFNAKVLDEHLPIAFEVLADMLLRPAFRDDDIAKEKGVILEELKMEMDNPEWMVHEAFISRFWKDHPLGKPILGTRETIEGFSRTLIQDYWRSVYSPAHLIFTAAGSIEHGRLVDLVAAEFGGLQPAPERAPVQAPAVSAPIIVKRKRSLEQAHLIIGLPSYHASHDRRYAAYTLNTLLGGSMSSRLFQIIREQRGLVYSVFSETSAYRDSGCLAVYAGTSASSLPQVISLILEEFRRFKEEMVGDEELARAKNHLKGSLILSLESTSSRMSNLARQEMYHQRYVPVEEIIANIEKVTAQDLIEVAREFFVPERIGLAALGPLNGFKPSRKQIVC